MGRNIEFKVVRNKFYKAHQTLFFYKDIIKLMGTVNSVYFMVIMEMHNSRYGLSPLKAIFIFYPEGF